MNYEQLTQQMFRELRGKRSQPATSRRLGFSANMAYLWESGRRSPPASTLFRLASFNARPLERLADFGLPQLHVARARSWETSDTTALLRALLGEQSAASLAKVARVNRTTASRWLHGATEPNVPHLLRCVEGFRHRLVDFVSIFADPAALPSVSQLALILERQRLLAYGEPWSHAVLRALELESYKALDAHVPGVLARTIGISEAEEARLLRILRQACLVHFRRGKWRPARVLTVDTRTNPRADQLLKEHWARVGLTRLQGSKPDREGFYSYNLCAVSHDDFARIRELHLEYYERARRIVSESHKAERVLLLNQQLVPLDE